MGLLTKPLHERSAGTEGLFAAVLLKNRCSQTGGYVPAGPGRHEEEKKGPVFLTLNTWPFQDRAGQAFTRLTFLKEADFGRTFSPFGNVYRMQYMNSEKVLFFLLPGLPFPQASTWL